MRNHEQVRSPKGWSPFRKAHRLHVLKAKLGISAKTHFLVVAHRSSTTPASGHVSHWLALAGTGHKWGATPWGTWLSCEEWVDVETTPPSETTDGCLRFPPTPMGNAPCLNHSEHWADSGTRPLLWIRNQACCISPKMSTMDSCTGLCPRSKVTCLPASCRRWRFKTRLARIFATGIKTLQDLPPSQATVCRWSGLICSIPTRLAGTFEFGATTTTARHVARGEGIWAGNGSVYVACTNGGRSRIGQIWRYHPSPFEGTDQEAASPGRLELFVESPDKLTLHYADNLVVAPWGDVFVSEDGEGHDRVIRIDPQGRCTPFLANRLSSSELTVCFSPDGNTMFVNEQGMG